jgi:hypothetical protein
LSNVETIQGSGKWSSEARPLGAFSRIESSGAIELEIAIGEPPSAVVETDDNLIAIVRTEVQGDRLVVRTDQSYRSSIGVRVKVQAPKLLELRQSGSGNAVGDGLKSERLALHIAGSSNTRLSGTAGELEVVLVGSGNFDLERLAAKDARVEIQGSGSIAVDVSGTLRARIMGSGNVSYGGGARVLERMVMGSGRISPK